MFGLNWVDAVIVVLLILAVIEGVRIGLLTQLFVVVGFFSTLFITGWIFPHLLPIQSTTIKTAANATCVLLAAIYVALRCFDLAQNIHWSLHLNDRFSKRNLKKIEAAFGSVAGLAAGLILVWLLGVAIGRMPFLGLSNSVSDSRIVQELTRTLPPVPAVFAEFDRQIDPNAQPYVFIQPKPSSDFNYSISDATQAETRGTASTVRITGFGCGGIVSGTGFGIGNHLIVTNAHVIAGIKRNIIKYNGLSYAGTPVYFDPTLDLALLYVPSLTIPSLPLSPGTTPLGSTVAVLGYPGGNYQSVPGLLRDTLAVSAKDIYDQGTSGRGIYVVQAHVNYGSSGSPIITKDGQVVGIIFSKPVTFSNYAYALTSPYITQAVHKLKSSHVRINTGACMVN